MAIVRSTAKYVRMSPTKAALVAGLVRGRSADEALQILQFTHKGAATPIFKAIRSAIANAENNHKLKRENLEIVRLETTAGPSLKRFRPRAKGSASRILKRTTHIHVELQERVAAPETPKAKSPTKPQAETKKSETTPTAEEQK